MKPLSVWLTTGTSAHFLEVCLAQYPRIYCHMIRAFILYPLGRSPSSPSVALPGPAAERAEAGSPGVVVEARGARTAAAAAVQEARVARAHAAGLRAAAFSSAVDAVAFSEVPAAAAAAVDSFVPASERRLFASLPFPSRRSGPSFTTSTWRNSVLSVDWRCISISIRINPTFFCETARAYVHKPSFSCLNTFLF